LSCAASPGGVGAFNTVQAGLNAATTAGDWVLIGDGTYDCTSDGSGDADVDGGCTVQGSGTSANAIVITYATTARGPVLRNANTATPNAYSQANNPTLNLTGHDYVTIRGLTIQGSIRAFNEKPASLAALKLGLRIEGNEITRGWATLTTAIGPVSGWRAAASRRCVATVSTTSRTPSPARVRNHR
jgi:hypothetical protein